MNGSVSSSSGASENKFWKYGLAGGFSAFSTHAFLVPLDVGFSLIFEATINIHVFQYIFQK